MLLRHVQTLRLECLSRKPLHAHTCRPTWLPNEQGVHAFIAEHHLLWVSHQARQPGLKCGVVVGAKSSIDEGT